MTVASHRSYVARFVVLVVAAAVALLLLAEAFDPYGENESRAMPGQVLFTSRVLTARALLRELGERPYDLVFGTSRSAMLTDEQLGRPVLNLYPIYGNPEAVLAFLQKLDETQWRNVGEVWYALDVATFCRGCYLETVDYTNGWDVLIYKVTHLPEAFARLPGDILRNLRGAPDSWVRFGATINGKPEVLDGSWARREVPPLVVEPHDERTLDLLASIDRLVREKSRVIHYFTPPLSDAALAKLDGAALARLKREFLRRLPGVDDLSRIPGLSDHPEDFLDASHANLRGGWRAICAARSGLYRVRPDEGDRIDPSRGVLTDAPRLPPACALPPGPRPRGG